MIYKPTQKTIDTLLRFKDSSNHDYSNRIASLMAKPNNQRTKEENQELTISIIQEMVRKENNKIASVQSDTGEVTLAEFVKLLRSVIPSS